MAGSLPFFHKFFAKNMNTLPLLNYQFHQPLSSNGESPKTLVFLHGLFGDLNNLSGIARAFGDRYAILKIDLRNHGRSFHHSDMNYHLMAEDVLAVLEHLELKSVILIGHSMGGKTAMATAALAPERVEKLVVIDIAPVTYTQNRHETFFAGLFAVSQAKPQNRIEAKHIMAEHIADEAIQQFMLKSFDINSPEHFLFNLSALKANYQNLMGWRDIFFEKPTLFIKGANSDYIQEKERTTILRQFPQAKSFVVANADHWVHAEKPEAVVRAVERFLGNIE